MNIFRDGLFVLSSPALCSDGCDVLSRCHVLTDKSCWILVKYFALNFRVALCFRNVCICFKLALPKVWASICHLVAVFLRFSAIFLVIAPSLTSHIWVDRWLPPGTPRDLYPYGSYMTSLCLSPTRGRALSCCNLWTTHPNWNVWNMVREALLFCFVLTLACESVLA